MSDQNVTVSTVQPVEVTVMTLNGAGSGSSTPAEVYITVSEITGGHRLTILDSSGSTKTVDVMDGVAGTNGTNGSDGSNGSDGVSPTISVSDITGGKRLTITDANGTQTVDILNGAKGDQGNPASWDDFTDAQKQAVIDGVVASVSGAAVPNTRTINGKALTSDITLTASDVGALPSTTTIPTKVSDLTNDSNFVTTTDLSSKQDKLTAGTNITITGNTISASGGTEVTSDAITTALGYTPANSANLHSHSNKAKLDTIPSTLTHETWTFELDDGTTVTKDVVLWS